MVTSWKLNKKLLLKNKDNEVPESSFMSLVVSKIEIELPQDS